MNFNWLDIIIGIVLVLTAFQGMRQGFALALFGFLAPFLSVFVANKGADQVAQVLLTFKLPSLISYYLALAGLIILVYWLTILVGKNFEFIVDNSFLKGFNSLGGFIAGAMTGGFYVFIVFFPLLFCFSWFNGLATTLEQSYIYYNSKPLIAKAKPLVETIIFKSASRWQENMVYKNVNKPIAVPELIDKAVKQTDVLSAY